MDWGLLVRWAKIVVVIAAVTFGLLYLILSGWLGETIQSSIDAKLVGTGTYLTRNAVVLDQIWKLIGGIVSIVSGTWLIYKIWYYADHNMPTRLHQFLTKMMSA